MKYIREDVERQHDVTAQSNVLEFLPTSSTSAHDRCQSKLVESLVACRILLAHRNFMAVFFNTAVERCVLQPVVSRWKWEICTASPQVAFQLGQIAP